MIKTNEELKQSNTHLNCQSVVVRGNGALSHQSLDPRVFQNHIKGSVDELSSEQKIDAIIASNRQYARRLTKPLVLKIISSKSLNSKLKQQIRGKNDFNSKTENNNNTTDDSEDVFTNEMLETEDKFEDLFNELKKLFADKSTQYMDSIAVPQLIQNN